MPNWCDCELDITGKSSELKRLLKEVTNGENEELDARKIIPYPFVYEEMDKAVEEWEKLHPDPKDWKDKPKDGYNSGGYEWCNAHWGTKWGFCHQDKPPYKDIDKEIGELHFDFDTAWSPPLPLIKRMSEIFPDLLFVIRYYEGGMGYQGEREYENGETLKEFYNEEYHGHRGG